MTNFTFVKRVICIGASLGLFANSAIAQDSAALLIMKTDGQPPMVEAGSVDLVGATQLYELLGENYIVMSGNKTFNPVRMPVPLKLPPGTKPPITPICQCPEGYIAALENRFLTIEVNPLLQRQSVNGFDHAKPVQQFGVDKNMMLEKFAVPGATPTFGGN